MDAAIIHDDGTFQERLRETGVHKLSTAILLHARTACQS